MTKEISEKAKQDLANQRQRLVEEQAKVAQLDAEMNAQRLAAARAASQLEQVAPTESETKPQPSSFTIPKPKPGDSDHWKLILADFIQQFGEEAQKGNTLVFPSKESAIAFFTAQAEQGREFLSQEVGHDGALTGFNLLSCGDGKLYKGTLQEIQNELLTAQTADPSNEKIAKGLTMVQQMLSIQNQTSQYRNQLKQQTEPGQAPESEAKSNLSPGA
jgi:hypothetical protein